MHLAHMLPNPPICPIFCVYAAPHATGRTSVAGDLSPTVTEILRPVRPAWSEPNYKYEGRNYTKLFMLPLLGIVDRKKIKTRANIFHEILLV